MLFPDVVLGAGYTPEELGARIADDDVIDVSSIDDVVVHQQIPTVTERGVKNALVERCQGSVDLAVELWDLRPISFREGGEHVTGAVTDSKGTVLVLEIDAAEAWLDSVIAQLKQLDAAAQTAGDDEIVDAEIVPDSPQPPPEAVPDAPVEPEPPADVPPAAEAAAAHSSSDEDSDEAAWQQLLSEVDALSVPDIGKRLRDAGEKPIGRKADLVQQLANLLLPQRLDDIDNGREVRGL
jgi:hypothetical protein